MQVVHSSFILEIETSFYSDPINGKQPLKKLFIPGIRQRGIGI